MKKLFLLWITLNILILNTLFSSFEDIPIGARVAGLNNCAVAVADDVFTSYINPAGLTNLNNLEIGIDYNKLLLNLSDASDLSGSAILFSKKFSNLGGFMFGYHRFALNGFYAENKFSFGYGKDISFLNRKIYLGTKINILNITFGKTSYTENAVNILTGVAKDAIDPVFEKGYSKTGISLDFGFMYNFLKNHNFGVVVENLNQPDMGLMDKSILPLTLKMGGMFCLLGAKAISEFSFNKDFINFGIAAEREIFINNTDKIMIRSGINFGSEEYANFSVGASYLYKNMFQLDYSFNYLLRGIITPYGSHQFSISVKFDSLKVLP